MNDPDALADLRFHWSGAYDITYQGGQYRAARRDGQGDALADPLPEGLRLRIKADYAAMPVPRDARPDTRKDNSTWLP